MLGALDFARSRGNAVNASAGVEGRCDICKDDGREIANRPYLTPCKLVGDQACSCLPNAIGTSLCGGLTSADRNPHLDRCRIGPHVSAAYPTSAVLAPSQNDSK